MNLKRALAALAGPLLVLAGFAAPAHAATPDRFGFGMWDGGTAPPATKSPPATTIVPWAVGRYRVTFPGQAARGGVVHVTAIDPHGRWCQAAAFGQAGPDELVFVDCYRPGGVRDWSGFTVVFNSSSGLTPAGLFGYVDVNPAGTVISEYNSSGALNSVGHTGVGVYEVKLPGLGTAGPFDGGLQVTAVGPNVGAHCKVGKWQSTPGAQYAVVLCFDAFGTRFDNRWTLTYQHKRAIYGGLAPPKYFGYVWNAPPVGPAPTNFNSVLGLGFNSLVPAGPGLTMVRFPAIGIRPDDVQVTAFGPGPEYCGMNTPWAVFGNDAVVRDVNCWTPAATPVNTGFFTTYASQA